MIDEQTIIKGASLLYSKYGIKSVIISDVASVIGISKKTIYEYFTGKDQLIEKVIDYNLESFLTSLIQKTSANDNIFRNLCLINLNIVTEVKKFNPSYVYDLKKYHHKQYLKILAFRDQKLFGLVESWIKKGIHTGIFRSDTDIRNVFQNIMHKISVLISDSGFVWNGNLSASKVYHLMLNDIRGITTLKGHEIFDREYDTFLQLKP